MVMLASSASTFASSVWLLIKLYHLFKDRARCKNGLKEELKSDNPRLKMQASKLLAMHYKVSYDSKGNKHRVSVGEWFEGQRGRIKGCIQCGRLTQEQLDAHEE